MPLVSLYAIVPLLTYDISKESAGVQSSPLFPPRCRAWYSSSGAEEVQCCGAVVFKARTYAVAYISYVRKLLGAFVFGACVFSSSKIYSPNLLLAAVGRNMYDMIRGVFVPTQGLPLFILFGKGQTGLRSW